MLKKLSDGLFFGAGFGVSFIFLWYVAAYFVSPLFAGPHLRQTVSDQFSQQGTVWQSETVENGGKGRTPSAPFHDLSMDEQVKQADAIALAKYRKAADGRMRAIITEFLKKPGAKVKYRIGDEDMLASYYPKPGTEHGDGLIIFFTGSSDTMSLAVYDGRIPSYGDITVEQFKNKYRESSDS